MAKFYDGLLEDGHVNSILLGEVLENCPTLVDKVHFLNALLLQPPNEKQCEWTEAFGLAWAWTDILYGSEYKIEVIRNGIDNPVTDGDNQVVH